MQYRTLDRTGVQVSTLVLGAMNFGSIGRRLVTELDHTPPALLDPTLRRR